MIFIHVDRNDRSEDFFRHRFERRIRRQDNGRFYKIADRLIAFSSEKNFGIRRLSGMFDISHDVVERCFIDHGMGIVIGETAEIGDDCTIYQGVTLGGTGKHTGKRHPTLGNRVMVSSGAKVLGPFSGGDDSKIGSGSVVLKEVPPGSTVVGIPGIVVKNKFGELTEDMDQVSIPDPIAVELECLRKRVVQLEEHLSATLGDKLEIFRVDESCEICQGRDIDEEKFDGRAETQIDDMMDEECEKQDDR